MNKLICTVGLPCSGKSTWARSQPYPIVNPDSIRLALHAPMPFNANAEPMVWTITDLMVKSLFLAGCLIVILDATNTTVARRKKWLSLDWETYYKVIETPVEICLLRAKERSNSEDIIKTIVKMNNTYEPLRDYEKIW